MDNKKVDELIIMCSIDPKEVTRALKRSDNHYSVVEPRVGLEREFVISQTRLRASTDPRLLGAYAARHCNDSTVLYEVAVYTRNYDILSAVIMNPHTSESTIEWIKASSPLAKNGRIVRELSDRRVRLVAEHMLRVNESNHKGPRVRRFSEVDEDTQYFVRAERLNEFGGRSGESWGALAYLSGGIKVDGEPVVPDASEMSELADMAGSQINWSDALLGNWQLNDGKSVAQELLSCGHEYICELVSVAKGLARAFVDRAIDGWERDTTTKKVVWFIYSKIEGTNFNLKLGLEAFLNNPEMSLNELCARLSAQARVINQKQR